MAKNISVYLGCDILIFLTVSQLIVYKSQACFKYTALAPWSIYFLSQFLS